MPRTVEKVPQKSGGGRDGREQGAVVELPASARTCPPSQAIGFQAGSATDSVSKVVQTSSVIGIRTLAEHESAWKTDALQGHQ